MNKPDVRIISHQQEEIKKEVDVSQSEVDYLLAKYGYKEKNIQQNINPIQPTNNQSFEDMIRQQENKKRYIEEEKKRKINQPRSISFDQENVRYSETKYSDMDLDNSKFGIKIQIVTDMKID